MNSHVRGPRGTRVHHGHAPSLLFAACALALLLSACGGASQQSSPPEPTGGAPASDAPSEAAEGDTSSGEEVLLENIAFKPDSLEVAVGTEVTWKNADEGVAHTATSGKGGSNAVPGVSDGKPNKPDGLFDGDLPDAGDTFSFTFEKAGTYPYFCEIHPSMTAEITVR